MAAKVSIILPTFNRLNFLRAAVDSVFAQTVSDWELIIADDGSEEETAVFLAELARSARVRVLRLPHSGNPGAVRNAGLRAAQGEYVAFLDSDDAWLPAKLETQLAAHTAFPSRRWSYTAPARIDAAGMPMRDGLGLHWTAYDGAIFEQLLTVSAAVATPGVLAERRLVEEAGGFDEGQRYFEDYDLWLRMSLLSDVISIREPLTQVRNHDLHYSADRIGVYQARFRLLDKMAEHAGTPRLRRVLRRERARNASDLALVSAIAGYRAAGLRMLWRSRECAWNRLEWWRKARATLAFCLAPKWLIEAVRHARRRRRAMRPRWRDSGAAPARPK